MLRRSWLAFCVAVVSLLALIPAASGQTPSSLTGESLFAFNVLEIGEVTTTPNCSSDPGGTSSFTFTASGIAEGPYMGTFTESGTVVLGPFVPQVGMPVLSFEAEFSIFTADTVITGTKSLMENLAVSPNVGDCSVGPNGFATTMGADVAVRYEATLTTPSGSFRDEGIGDADVTGSRINATGEPGVSFFFRENYVSEGISPLGPANVELTPATAVNNVGTSHTVTATVTDAAGGPVSGTTVRFTVQGSVNRSGSCTTAANGQCSFTYTGPALPGADLIRACADSDENGTISPDEPCGEATKAWLLPTTTPGQVTGGGQVPGSTDDVAFGFNANSTTSGLKGNCSVVDPATDTHVKCRDVTTLVVSSTHATFFGNATVNGVATTYRIDVDDLGEPGAGRDTFRVQTASGYTAGGVLTHGNIQIHK